MWAPVRAEPSWPSPASREPTCLPGRPIFLLVGRGQQEPVDKRSRRDDPGLPRRAHLALACWEASPHRPRLGRAEQGPSTGEEAPRPDQSRTKAVIKGSG